MKTEWLTTLPEENEIVFVKIVKIFTQEHPFIGLACYCNGQYYFIQSSLEDKCENSMEYYGMKILGWKPIIYPEI